MYFSSIPEAYAPVGAPLRYTLTGFDSIYLEGAGEIRFTRLLVQPRLDLRTGRIGTLAPESDNGTAPDETALRALRRSLRCEADALLRRAVAHLEAHAALFPAYDSDRNPLNRCTTDGGFVQIR